MKVLLLPMPLPWGPIVDAIGRLAPGIEPVAYRADMDDAECASIEVALGWSLPTGVAPRLPHLRWVASIAAGVEKLLASDLPAHVAVTRIVDPEQAAGIAQYVVLMALRHARALPLYEAQQRERRWVRVPVGAARDRVVVLGGTGAVGRAVRVALESVGFEVRGWSRGEGGALDGALAGADIVVCALPLTAATHGLLDARAFALMPPGSYLVNVARGQHVVEADLIEAIGVGRLTGAALDVQCREPLPPDDPLWGVPAITITPHIAAQSSSATIAAQFVTALACFRRGAALPNLVDRTRGY